MTLHRIGRTLRGHQCHPPPTRDTENYGPGPDEGDLFQCDECGTWYELVAGERGLIWSQIWGSAARRRLRRAARSVNSQEEP